MSNPNTKGQYHEGPHNFYDGSHAVLVTHQAAMQVEILKHRRAENGEWMLVVRVKPFIVLEVRNKTNRRTKKPKDPADRLLENASGT